MKKSTSTLLLKAFNLLCIVIALLKLNDAIKTSDWAATALFMALILCFIESLLFHSKLTHLFKMTLTEIYQSFKETPTHRSPLQKALFCGQSLLLILSFTLLIFNQ